MDLQQRQDPADQQSKRALPSSPDQDTAKCSKMPLLPETPRQQDQKPPPSKRRKSEESAPPMGKSADIEARQADMTCVARHPPNFYRSTSSTSVSSDLSSSSANTRDQHVFSPLPSSFHNEIPAAPPSTPASMISSNYYADAGTVSSTHSPLPLAPEIANASKLEQEQYLAEEAATPAPNREKKMPRDDFSEWAVGDRYELMRILGRGSYGEVAQARDLYAEEEDTYVAIKRVQSPFDQEIDAVRIYREMHLLRLMRGHDSIIQLLDVVQPPTDDLDDFHDLYLVFECKYSVTGTDSLAEYDFLTDCRCGHGSLQTHYVASVPHDGAHSNLFVSDFNWIEVYSFILCDP